MKKTLTNTILILMMLQAAQAQTSNHFYAGNYHIATKLDEMSYTYLDRLGTNTEAKHLPFGQSIITAQQPGFTGKEQDNTGLHYFGARYYDSNLGIFTSKDPIEESHPYQYVHNNPLNKVDPTGKQAIAGPRIDAMIKGIPPEAEITYFDNTRLDIMFPEEDFWQMEGSEVLFEGTTCFNCNGAYTDIRQTGVLDFSGGDYTISIELSGIQEAEQPGKPQAVESGSATMKMTIDGKSYRYPSQRFEDAPQENLEELVKANTEYMSIEVVNAEGNRGEPYLYPVTPERKALGQALGIPLRWEEGVEMDPFMPSYITFWDSAAETQEPITILHYWGADNE